MAGFPASVCIADKNRTASNYRRIHFHSPWHDRHLFTLQVNLHRPQHAPEPLIWLLTCVSKRKVNGKLVINKNIQHEFILPTP